MYRERKEFAYKGNGRMNCKKLKIKNKNKPHQTSGFESV